MRRDPTEFRKRFLKWKSGAKPYLYGIPYEDDNHNLDYDQARANQLGYTADETGHYPTRDYETGRYLKSVAHPTVSKSIYTDMGLGYDILYNDKDKSLYSQPNFGSTYKERLPKFAGGKPTQVGEYNVYPSAIGASELNVTTPDIVVTGKDKRPAWKRMYLNPRLGDTSLYYNRDAIRSITDWTPGIGDVSQGFDAYHAVKNGNYGEAAMLGGLLLLPNIIETPLKIAGKTIRKGIKNITPSEWTAALDAAIASGDMTEAQRLRDLHFKANAPNTKIDVPLWTSSEDTFNAFDLSHFGETDSGFFGYGHYLTPLEKYAASYHPVNRKFYVNMENPYIGNNDQYFNRVQYVKDRLSRRKENVMRNIRNGKLTNFSKKLGINENTSLELAEHLVDKYITDETIKWNDKYVKYADEFKGKDGVLSWRELQGIPNKQEGIYREVVVPKGEQIKSADAVTYDDKGVRIPLGERDNFNINDIRYGLLPFLGISAGYGLYNQQQ